MNKTKSIIASLSIITVVSAFLLFTPTLIQAKEGHDHKMHEAKGKPLTLKAIHSHQLPMLSDTLEKAIQAIKSGDDKTALSELLKAQKSVKTVKQALGKHVQPKFVNTKCPIMGSPINPAKVPGNLIREYKGEKVAFCCGGCPAMWDKLSDKEKESKLSKVKVKTESQSHNHSH
ncbi:MAG: hypothetical protein ACYTER_02480 [Planctomycetota bacterium]|jgi:hypothetical protein